MYPSEFTSLCLVEKLVSVHSFSTDRMKKYAKKKACNAEDRVYLSLT